MATAPFIRSYPAALTAVLLLLLTACGGAGRPATLPPPNPAAQPEQEAPAAVRGALPSIDELPRLASSTAIRQLGSEAAVTQFCTPEPNGDLTLSPVPSGSKAEGLPPLTYAIFVYQGLSEVPAAVVSKTGSNSQSELWMALADWENKQWRFEPLPFFTDPGLLFEQLGGEAERFLDPDGRLAVAFVMHDGPAPVRLRWVELAVPPQVQDLTATTDRWDVVRVTWHIVPTADVYMVLRRPVGSTEPWIPLGTLDRFDKQIDDTEAIGLVEYDYRVATGQTYQIRGQFHLLWNSGAITQGRRRLAELLIDPSVEAHWPVNLHNRLGLVHVTDEQPQEPALARATTYPPGEGWTLQHSGEDGFGPFDLPDTSQFGEPPVGLFQTATVNNTSVTMGYSNADGVFVQVAEVDSDGLPAWEPAVQLRGPGPRHFIDFADYNNLILAFMWDNDASKLQAMISLDPRGRTWLNFDPDSWMTVSGRRPAGAVRGDFTTLNLYLSYREAGTDEAVVILGQDDWIDVSPELVVRGMPQMRTCKLDLITTATGLFHITADGSEIRYLLRRDGDWRPDESKLVATAIGGGITQYDMYAQDSGSVNTYLAWVEDGNVWFSFSEDPGFKVWTTPKLVDGAGTCRDVRVKFVATDSGGESNYILATYLKELEDGKLQLSYQDMKSLRLDP